MDSVPLWWTLRRIASTQAQPRDQVPAVHPPARPQRMKTNLDVDSSHECVLGTTVWSFRFETELSPDSRSIPQRLACQ